MKTIFTDDIKFDIDYALTFVLAKYQKRSGIVDGDTDYETTFHYHQAIETMALEVAKVLREQLVANGISDVKIIRFNND